MSTLIKLSNTVKSVALTTEASQQDIDAAEEKLREVIELLASESSSGNSGSDEFGTCYDFAYQKYSQGYAASTAADKSVQAATVLGKNSLVCVEKLYASYSQSYSAVTAMDKSAEGCAK